MKKLFVVLAAMLLMISPGCSGGGGGDNSSEKAATTYSISGTVSGAVLQGVTITLTGSSSASTTTDASGNYNFSSVANGSYTITPAMIGYTFSPTIISTTVNNANLTEQNFTATVNATPTYSITGNVSGAVLQGVTITLTGTGSSTTTTDASGNYSFSGASNGSYTITPSMTGYTFSPANISAAINGVNITGQNFAVTALATGYDYTTTFTLVTSQFVNASSGGTIQVTDLASSLNGLKLTIPGGALQNNQTITISRVNNPPALPTGLNYIGAPVRFGPNGTTFNTPITIEIPYTDQQLSDAGISDDTALKLYYYSESTNQWTEATIISIDTVNNKMTAQITHFSYYAVTGWNGTPPKDLGHPQPGDLLFKTGSIFGDHSKGWRPGHVGIYVGEKVHGGNPYNVIEALNDGVTRSYYNPISDFGRDDQYMGAREPANFTLTPKQRDDIVTYVENQVGKPYAWVQTDLVLFGMLSGSLVKGPNSFNCVGLAEKAYEKAVANGGDGLVTFWQENIGVGEPAALTPAEMYNETKPAGGIIAQPKIEWATLTPNSGTECTSILAQIAVSHPDGLSSIGSVIYVTDNGYTNPNININDTGLQGDITAGDGVYSTKDAAGGDSIQGELGLTFTVTDISGKTDTIRLVYTYLGTCN